MPGTFIIRPIEANLTHNTDIIGRMNPYCAVVVGNTRVKGQICKHGGKHPHWNDAITVPATNESKILIEIMDKDKISHDDNIGSLVLDLQEVQASGQVSRWYPLTYKNKAAGEILLETVFQPDNLSGQGQYYQEGQQYAGTGFVGQTGYGQNQYYQEEQILTSQPQLVQEEIITTSTQPAELIQTQETVQTTTTTTQPAVVQEEVIVQQQPRGHVWTEQHQVVEPHKFMKEVEVVETRASLKEIEVMEPVKVWKDVQFTQAVPVRKQIEVMEPQVVVKEVEVIEPRLVTKTIQVVENVPVTRQVEVIEMRNAIQEVDTVEPQTFTKQIEVTEYMPFKRSVEVTQPVVLKKSVEFVEPVITTQTITKQMQEAVIIDEQITTTVGPASVVGISQEYGYIQNWGEISLDERQRISGLERWVGFEKLFTGLTEQERFFEQQRLSRLSEQEWIREQQRLLAMAEQDRIHHQKHIYSNYYTTRQGGLQSGYQGGFSTGHNRWHGLEHLFGGLNEKERQFEQERWNRLSEQEWLQEQKRLSAFNQQDRLLEQRRLYNDYLQTGGFSTYKKTTEFIEQTNAAGGHQGFIQGNQGFVQNSQNISAPTHNPIC